MLAGAVLLVGCADRSGDSEAGDASPLTLGAGHSASDAARVVEWEAVPEDLRALSHYEIYRGGATEHHGVSRLLREVGAVELLESYIINIPPSAPFLVGFELSKPESTDWPSVSAGFLGRWRVGVAPGCWGCGLVCLGVLG